MTEKQFRTFLENRKLDTQKIQSILKDISANSLREEAELKYISLTLEETEIMAGLLRTKFATSISLIESGVASYKDLID